MNGVLCHCWIANIYFPDIVVPTEEQHGVVKEVDEGAECEEHEPEPEEDEDLLDDDVGGEEAQEVHGLHAAALAHLPPDTHAQPANKISFHVTRYMI